MPKLKSILLCAKTASQPKYLLLKELVMGHNASARSEKELINFSEISCDQLPSPEDVEKDSVVIFDDVLSEKIDDQIGLFFMRSRHRGISVFYLAQSYCKIPKKSAIRDNTSYMLIFRTDMIALRQIYAEQITSISFDKFKDMCHKCWDDNPFGFLVVDIESREAKYKQNFEFVFKVVEE